MSDLAQKKCIPCEGGVPPLGAEESAKLLAQVHEWRISPDGLRISRSFSFKNFVEAVEFVNKITPIAESENHHPDLCVSWGKVRIDLTTHAIGGLSENDFILAAKIDELTSAK